MRSRLLPAGDYTVKPVYLIGRQLRRFRDHDEVHWSAKGTEWLFPIDQARPMVRLPSDARIESVATYARASSETGSTATANIGPTLSRQTHRSCDRNLPAVWLQGGELRLPWHRASGAEDRHGVIGRWMIRRRLMGYRHESLNGHAHPRQASARNAKILLNLGIFFAFFVFGVMFLVFPRYFFTADSRRIHGHDA